jgi:hypothetical protein
MIAYALGWHTNNGAPKRIEPLVANLQAAFVA